MLCVEADELCSQIYTYTTYEGKIRKKNSTFLSPYCVRIILLATISVFFQFFSFVYATNVCVCVCVWVIPVYSARTAHIV